LIYINSPGDLAASLGAMRLIDPHASTPELARGSATTCAHCGDSLADARIVRRHVRGTERSFCCLGCAFVAEQLEQLHIGSADLPPAAHPQPPTDLVHLQRPVTGMVCSACALLIEHRLRRERGVVQASVDFASSRACIDFDAALTSTSQIERVIQRAGYGIAPLGAESATRRRRVGLLRVLVAWLAMMQVMMLAVPAYLAQPGEIAPDIAQLLRIVQLILTVPVLVFSAQPLARAALNQLRTHSVGMDLPIVLGLGVAFATSVVATWRADGPVYFDSIAMFVALVLGVRWLQACALDAALGHVDKALQNARLFARKLRAYPASTESDVVAAEALEVGDHVLVPSGDTVPADGVVVHGSSAVSQAWLTGEASAVDVQRGTSVAAGAINLDQPLVVRVERCGESTALAGLRRSVDAAGRTRPRVFELANRVAAVFLFVVPAVALATLLVWWFVDPARAVPSAIAVLIATCPCALSLAAPAAITAAQAAFARRGILTTRVAAIERLAQVDTFACDKTGTLTSQVPELRRILPLRAIASQRALACAASLEAFSNHPFALALLRAARTATAVVPDATDVSSAAAGVEGSVDGRRLRIGKLDYALGLVAHRSRSAAEVVEALARHGLREASVVLLADSSGPLAVFAFGEVPRTGAQALIGQIHAAGARMLIVSGDRREPVVRAAHELGLLTPDENNVFAQQTPDSKRRLVAMLQAEGHDVAMLGDGLNDAPVIAQADVSIAMAEGAALAQSRADFICLRSNLADVAALFAGSRKAMRLVRENLWWAVAYNVVVIPLAALGYLTPALAAVGMAASSLLVVGNALRARLIPRRTH
jgi:Cu2+-exporting ATPase